MSYEQEAATLAQPITTTRDKVIEDKIVIDRKHKKAVLCYRVGRFNTDGEFVDTEERTAIYRDADFDKAIEDVFGSDTELQTRLGKVRNKAKAALEKDLGLTKGSL